MSEGEENRRSKCTPSTSASVVRTWRDPRSGAATAASSPIPTTSAGGPGGTRLRIRSISARSPTSETRCCCRLPGELNGPGLPDDCDLDLARIFELVLDPAGDVLRQPHGLFVGDAFAFDQDSNLPPGLKGERLRHALERIGDALELFESLDVGLEDVAPGTRPGGGDGVGRLHDHRLERRPVDIHVMSG